MAAIKIKFWGVRGSIPTPGPRTIRYGGNTSCIEINFPNRPRFILDAGSGIRELGKLLLQSTEPEKSYIFLTHFHWDHIQGLPFFKPAFKPENHFVIYGCDEPDVDLTKIISMQMNPIYFPVAVDDMRAKIEFRTIKEGEFEVEGITVNTQFMNHPGYTLGYRFNFNGKSIIYISDNEPFRKPDEKSNTNVVASLQDRFESYYDNKDEQLIEFIAGADILIHDTQYFPDEYQQRITWGHSPYTYTVDIAVEARVKKLILFHHDPDHDDQAVDRMAELSRERLKRYNYEIPCIPAREGDILVL
jgi:phosphoribosyl 1,2-cyclic phosphodiesterase